MPTETCWLIADLYGIADAHRKHCRDPMCCCNLGALKKAAKIVLERTPVPVTKAEAEAIQQWFDLWPD